MRYRALSGNGIGGGIFALGCPLKVQPGIKSGGIWLYHADLWRALIRDFIAGGGHLAHRRFGDLFDPGIHRNTYGAEKLISAPFLSVYSYKILVSADLVILIPDIAVDLFDDNIIGKGRIHLYGRGLANLFTTDGFAQR